MEKNFETYVKHEDNTVHIFNSSRVQEGDTVTYSFRFAKEVSAAEIDADILRDCEETGYTRR